jgi:hypothetical protein
MTIYQVIVILFYILVGPSVLTNNQPEKLFKLYFVLKFTNDYPVCFDFPISHALENFAVRQGGAYTLEVTNEAVVLKAR